MAGSANQLSQCLQNFGRARATRLHSNLAQLNTLNPEFYGLGNDLFLNVNDPQAQTDLAALGVTVPSWFVPLWSPSGEDTLGQLLRPLPQYRTVDNSPLENSGQASYNALQAKVERRFRNGLNLLAVSSFYQQMAIGTVLVLAVWLDQLNRARRQ